MKAYIFDFFGVISTEVSEIWFSKLFSEEETIKIRSTLSKDVDIGNIDDEQFFSGLSEISGITSDKIKEQWFNLVSINNDVIKFIKKAKKNHKIVLLSNAPQKFLRGVLKEFELESLFDLIIISAEVKMIKPEIDIFKYTINQLNINPNDALFIDDNKKNIEGACKLGINTIHFKRIEDLENINF